MKRDPVAERAEDVAELLAFVAEAYEVAKVLDARGWTDLGRRLRAVADEQARRLPSLGRYIKSMAHVYRDRRDPR